MITSRYICDENVEIQLLEGTKSLHSPVTCGSISIVPFGKYERDSFGEVPKLAEGAPLERE